MFRTVDKVVVRALRVNEAPMAQSCMPARGGHACARLYRQFFKRSAACPPGATGARKARALYERVCMRNAQALPKRYQGRRRSGGVVVWVGR